MPVPPPHLTLVRPPWKSQLGPEDGGGASLFPKHPRAGQKARSSAGPSPPAPPTGGPLGPSQARDTHVGPPTPQAACERLLRPPPPSLGRAQPPLPGLDASLTMTAAGRGRVPPAPFLRSPAAGRGGGPNCCRCGPSEAPVAPLCSPLPPTPAANRARSSAHPRCPAALSRPRAHRRSFISAHRPRPLAAPSRRASTRDVSAHGPRRSTGSLPSSKLRAEVGEGALRGPANEGARWSGRGSGRMEWRRKGSRVEEDVKGDATADWPV